MHAAGQRRIEAAQPFVLAAGARLETLPALRDTMLDRGVIADVEMQKLVLAEGAPIAPVHHSRLLQVESARDQPVAPKRAHQAYMALERRHHLEELQREILASPVALVDRGLVQRLHR